MIAMVNPVPYNSNTFKDTFAILLIASSRKTHNSQSLESRNQNPTYGIASPVCVSATLIIDIV